MHKLPLLVIVSFSLLAFASSARADPDAALAEDGACVVTGALLPGGLSTSSVVRTVTPRGTTQMSCSFDVPESSCSPTVIKEDGFLCSVPVPGGVAHTNTAEFVYRPGSRQAVLTCEYMAN
jgi:hypothetical protein